MQELTGLLEVAAGSREGSSEERALNTTAVDWPCWASGESLSARPQSVKEVDYVKSIPLTVKVTAIPSACARARMCTHTHGKLGLWNDDPDKLSPLSQPQVQGAALTIGTDGQGGQKE